MSASKRCRKPLSYREAVFCGLPRGHVEPCHPNLCQRPVLTDADQIYRPRPKTKPCGYFAIAGSTFCTIHQEKK